MTTPPPPLAGHMWPQAPQLDVLAEVLVQIPLQHWPKEQGVSLAAVTHKVPPLHVWHVLQVPQLMLPPHPSGAVPQFCPAGHDVAGVQPQTPAVPPPPQVCGAVQVPQLMLPPQPSGAVPQFCPAGHDVAGVQPQTPAVPPPPQVCGGVQVPQLMLPPHPSGAVPQLSPAGHDVAGVQPQTLGVPPPPHVSGAVQTVPHVPQLLLSLARFTHMFPPQRLSPAGQQMPNKGGRATLGFAQFRLQQLMGVGHRWPLGLHGLGRASWAASVRAATTARAKTVADGDIRVSIASPSPLPVPANGSLMCALEAAELSAESARGSSTPPRRPHVYPAPPPNRRDLTA